MSTLITSYSCKMHKKTLSDKKFANRKCTFYHFASSHSNPQVGYTIWISGSFFYICDAINWMYSKYNPLQQKSKRKGYPKGGTNVFENFVIQKVWPCLQLSKFVKITIIICNFSLCLANQVFSHEKKLFHGEKLFLEWEFVN